MNNFLKKKIYFVAGVVGLGVILVLISNLVYSRNKTAPTYPNASSSSHQASLSSSPTATPIKKLSLVLPFDIKYFSPHSFGIYPFGVKSTEHPEGHAGINFEVTKNTPVFAPIDMTVLTISHPPGRVDEYNVVSIAGNYRIEILRLGTISMEVQLDAPLKKSTLLGTAGFNTAAQVYQFHMGISNLAGDALCPSEDYWAAPAWQQLQILLQSSQYQSVCLSPSPIPTAKRNLE